MPGWIREHPVAATIIAVGCAAALLFVTGYVRRYNEDMARIIFGLENAGRSGAVTDLADVGALAEDNPEEAWLKLEPILEEPADEDQYGHAQAMAGDILLRCFRYDVEHGHEKDAARWVNRMETYAAAASEAGILLREWGAFLTERWRAAEETDDEEATRRYLEELFEKGYGAGAPGFFEEYQARRLEDWARARERGDVAEARRQLLAATRVLVSAEPDAAIVKTLAASDLAPEDLLSLADSLYEQGRVGRALPFYQAAASKGDTRVGFEAARARERALECRRRLADLIRTGSADVMTALQPRDIRPD